MKLYNGGTSTGKNMDIADRTTTGTNTTTTTTTTTAPCCRPYDTLGPPSNPIEFPRPQLVRGRRDTVVCYNSITDEHEVLENVLFRDCLGRYSSSSATNNNNHNNNAENHSNEFSAPSSSSSRRTTANNHRNANNNNNNNNDIIKAYWPIPFKAKIQTIMGHVEMCRVLKRCTHERDDDDDLDDSDDGYDDDDEIVFEWTDQRVAVKVNYTDRMDRLRDRHAENPLQEIAAMQLLGSDPIHVLGAMDVLFDGQNLNLVMRYCDSGDLFQLLQDRQNSIFETHTAAARSIINSDEPSVSPPPGLPEGEVRYWFRQVMDGVKYLHSCGICHRDLSPENIMIDGDEGVIIDMGMCLRVPYIDPNNANNKAVTTVDITKTDGRTRTTAKRCLIHPQGACGKLPYMCPEILASRHPFDGEAADVWTSGTILFCMITGNRSYQRPHMTDPQFYWMTQGLRQLLSDWNVVISEEGIALLQGMLTIDPRQRLTLDEVCTHPWFCFPDEPPMKMETEPIL